MFETAELGRSLTKEEYEAAVPQLRTDLLRAQHDLAKADFPVLIVVDGVEGAGKGDTVNLLSGWLDARYLRTSPFFGTPTEEEAQHPEYWRYWRDLPPNGRIAVYAGSWYTQLIRDRLRGDVGDAELDATLVKVRSFEKALTDAGALLLKLWFHVPKAAQAARFQKLAAERETRWRVTKQDWKLHKRYDDLVRVAGRVLRETSTGDAPWTLIEGTDARYRYATVATHIAGRIRARLDVATPRVAPPPPPSEIPNPYTILDTLDLGAQVEKSAYQAELPLLQGRLNRLGRKLPKRKIGVILVFEGSDAAGKGGAIRRITQALDARQYAVIPIAAPSPEEKSHHYLWRFWRQIPRPGRITIYDRSWYGRVLVERVEGFASDQEWGRAYKEINDFESQLVEHGIVLCKFWLHISAEEQLRRFQERETKTYKQYKITAEDYRNRAKTNLYELAANDMIGLTSTEYAPWTLVEGEDKRFARLKILRTVCERIELQLAASHG